jgi:hypothetical protein
MYTVDASVPLFFVDIICLAFQVLAAMVMKMCAELPALSDTEMLEV